MLVEDDSVKCIVIYSPAISEDVDKLHGHVWSLV
jgi:hypothetical protein